MKKLIIGLFWFFFLNSICYAETIVCDYEKYQRQTEEYIKNNDFISSIELTTACINLHPDYANLYNNRANSYKRLEDYDRAYEDYRKAVELDPDYANPYIGMGHVLSEKGQYESAIESLNEAIKRDANSYQAYNSRGVVKFLNNDVQGAVKDFKKAKELGLPVGIFEKNMSNAEYVLANPYKKAIISVEYLNRSRKI